MKLHNKKFLLLSLLTAVFVCSCDKDDSSFAGRDNHIASFQLKQGDVTLTADVSDGSILLTVPENFSLEGAKAIVAISENAGIAPDPASVTKWDVEQIFTVTSYNGVKSTYKYSVQRNAIVKDGDVTLLNQADVEALAALNISRIDGSLTVGAATGKDSVYSLAPLATLKSVAFGVTVNTTYAGKDLAGLENLEQAGSLQIVQNKRLESVDFPKLVSVMSNLSVNQSVVRTLHFPELVNVDKGLKIESADSLRSANFPKLKTVIENLTLTGGNNAKLPHIVFPALEKVGGNISISNWKETASVGMPLLATATAVNVTGMSKLTGLSMPKLKGVMAGCTVSSNALMTSMDFSALQTVGGDCQVSYNNALENLDGMKSLLSVGGELSMSSLKALKNIQGLKSLSSVGGRMYLSEWPLLEDETLGGLSGLTRVGGELTFYGIPFKKLSGLALKEVDKLTIYGNGLSSIAEIDVRGIDIKTQLSINEVTTPFSLKGKDVYDCQLIISECSLNLEGFKQVKDFTYSMSKDQSDQTVPIQKITGNLRVSISNFTRFSMPYLTEVGGKFTLGVYQAMQTVSFPVLGKAGEAELEVTALTSFSLPALQTVNGDCNILTGNYQGDQLATLEMKSLTTVNGVLSIGGYSSYYTNKALTDLGGFLNLRSAKGVSISYNAALTDFTGMKDVIASFGASDWKVTGNDYNPTYQNMVEQKYTKP